MSLVITLLLAFAGLAHADDTIQIQKPTPVYQKPAFDARVLYNLRVGDRIEVSKTKVPEFLQIKLKRRGHLYQGYVIRADVIAEPLPESERSRGEWGFGGGFEYTSLSQGGRSFITDDQVQYTTSAYKSAASAPFAAMQMNYEDFWRLTLALKKTHWTATAKTNVSGSTDQAVDLQQTFYSVLLQKAWMPLTSKVFYFGVGGEVAKAMAVNLKLGNTTLETSATDQPTYFGVLGFAGASFSLGRSFSLFAEARYEYITNQSPAIIGLEAALGLLYWP